nr:hypothetical protein [Pseudolysinimonas kribbensis]
MRKRISSKPSNASTVVENHPAEKISPPMIASPHTPWTTRRPNTESRANSSSTWIGFQSPESIANWTRSVSVTVRAPDTSSSPVARSSK